MPAARSSQAVAWGHVMRTRFGLRLGLTMLVSGIFLAALAVPGLAQQAAPAAEPPAEVKAFVDLMGNPAVRNWLQTQFAALPTPSPSEPVPVPVESTSEFESFAAANLERLREHRGNLVAGLPRLPAELAAAISRLVDEVGRLGLAALAPLVALFVGAGFLA